MKLREGKLVGLACCALALVPASGAARPPITEREILAREAAEQASIREEGRDAIDNTTRQDRRVVAKRIAALRRAQEAKTNERERQMQFDRAFAEIAARFNSSSWDNGGGGESGVVQDLPGGGGSLPAVAEGGSGMGYDPGSATVRQALPTAMRVTSRPGLVVSPFAPNQGYVDVRGLAPGTQVRDPYTGRTFVVP